MGKLQGIVMIIAMIPMGFPLVPGDFQLSDLCDGKLGFNTSDNQGYQLRPLICYASGWLSGNLSTLWVVFQPKFFWTTRTKIKHPFLFPFILPQPIQSSSTSSLATISPVSPTNPGTTLVTTSPPATTSIPSMPTVPTTAAPTTMPLTTVVTTPPPPPLTTVVTTPPPPPLTTVVTTPPPPPLTTAPTDGTTPTVAAAETSPGG